MLKTAEDAYFQKEDLSQTKTALNELAESAELAFTSLQETSKNPSKHPRHFIDAEIRIRELLRRLNDFGERMSALDRDLVTSVRATLQKVREDLLAAIMGTKQRKKD